MHTYSNLAFFWSVEDKEIALVNHAQPAPRYEISVRMMPPRLQWILNLYDGRNQKPFSGKSGKSVLSGKSMFFYRICADFYLGVKNFLFWPQKSTSGPKISAVWCKLHQNRIDIGKVRKVLKIRIWAKSGFLTNICSA